MSNTDLHLVGDIHKGKRFPFTNKKTAARFEDLKNSTLDSIFSLPGAHIQMGDLFDDNTVDSSVFIEGYRVASKCLAVLSGNHDVSNNTELRSAVESLREFGCNVAWENVITVDRGKYRYVIVPHQLTQEKFEAALQEAALFVQGSFDFHCLLLHCNYGLREGTQTENYLRPEVATLMLEKGFDSIVSGHEHNASQPMKGVTMMGSILPMNFGEMTDKYVYDVGEGTGCLKRVWDAGYNYLKLDFKEFLELPVDRPLQFIEVTGTVDIAETVLLSKRVVDWYLHSETLIAIKNSTTAFRTEVSLKEDFKAADWISRVSALMTDEENAVFTELLGVQNAR